MAKDKMNIPQIRFKGFEGEWAIKALGAISTRVTRKNSELESDLPLTISAQYGLVDQRTYFDRQIASRDISGYFLIKKGEFAYNKSYSNGYPLGTIKRLDKYDSGVLSTLYIVFRINDKVVKSDYISAYYDTTFWHKEVSMYAAEGARNHGLLNIAPTDFFKTMVKFPISTMEQTQIGDFFQKIDQVIELQQKALDTARAYKQSMLQKMFPQKGEKVPRVRFAGFSGDWERKKLGFFGKIRMCKRIFKEETMDIGDIPFYKIGTFGKKPDSFISEEIYKEYVEKYPYPEKGDILISASGTIGRTVVYNGEKAYYQDSNIVWLEHNRKKLLNEYLLQVLNNTSWNELEGSTIKRLYNNDLLNKEYFFPNIKEQTVIANFFQKLDQQIGQQAQKLATYQQLKKAMLQRMFV